MDKKLLDKIKDFISGKENVDVTISIREFDRDYAEILNKSLAEAETGDNLLTFTMEDFMIYTPSK